MYDILTKAGASPGLPNGNFLRRSFGGRGYPPTAAQWADPNFNIPNWNVVASPQAGDVVAFASEVSSGHVGIMISSYRSIGANSTIVRETDFGSNPAHLDSGASYVYRRYSSTP